MAVQRVAYRFAKALLRFSVERNELEATMADMTLIEKTCRESRELRNLLVSPVVKTDKKSRIFRRIFEGKISVSSLTFFNIIFRRSREEMIAEIASSFIAQYKIHKRIHTVKVETASPLSAENRERIMRFLKEHSSDPVELSESVNENLIGGVVIRLRDLQLDASVANQLKKLRKNYSQEIFIRHI